MPTVLPYIPQRITVHLGTPNSDAENVTVSFPDYVKNVASSEIYPTWDEDALRAATSRSRTVCPPVNPRRAPHVCGCAPP